MFQWKSRKERPGLFGNRAEQMTELNSIQNVIHEVYEALPGSRIAEVFENCYSNTITKTLQQDPDGTCFVITGDIPAMWLRDSSCQLRPYLFLAAADEEMAALISGVIRRQVRCILQDPYANAFNREANGAGYQDDHTQMQPILWERKYEIDSLCFPVDLSWQYWQKSGRTDIFDENWKNMAQSVLHVFRTEQYHESRSPYRFVRTNCPATDTLARDGKGAPVREGIGLIWSGFRPSDDACTYGYLIPSNMFAVVILRQMADIAEKVYSDLSWKKEALELAEEVDAAIHTYGITEKDGKKIYAYEVDGFGNALIMDDANFPSLLSAPHLGYGTIQDELYVNTRSVILSKANPYYYEGTHLRGIGSPHTPVNFVWDLSLAMQALTTDNREEQRALLEQMVRNDAGTGMMHEGINCNNPKDFTREWFSWANAVYCELVLSYTGIA